MQLSKTQITSLLTEVASQEDGFNELLRMSFEAMMKAKRQEHLTQAAGDKGNGFRQVTNSIWAGQDVGTSHSSHPRWQFLSAVDERFARPGRGVSQDRF